MKGKLQIASSAPPPPRHDDTRTMAYRGTDLTIHRARFVEWAPKTVFALAFVGGDGEGGGTRARVAVARSAAELELWTFDEFGSRWHWEWRVPGVCGGNVRALAWAGGNRLFVAGIEGTILELNLRKLRYERAIRSHGGAVWAMAVCPERTTLAVGCNDGHVRLFSLWPGGQQGTNPHGARGEQLIYRRSLLCASAGDGAQARAERDTASPPRVLAVCWHPADRTSIFVGCSDGIIRRFRTTSGVCEVRIAAEVRGGDATRRRGASVMALCALTDGTLVSGDSLGNIQFWDGRLGTMVATFNKHEAGVLALAVSADERRVFGSGVDCRVAMFQRCCPPASAAAVRSGGHWMYSHSHRAHTHDVRAMATFRFRKRETPGGGECPSHEVLVTGGEDAELCCYSVPFFELTRPKKAVPLPHRGTGGVAVSAARSRNTRTVLVQHDRTLHVWELFENGIGTQLSGEHHGNTTAADGPSTAGRHLLQLVVSSNFHITCSALSPDGGTIAVSNARGVRFYSLEHRRRHGVGSVAVRCCKKFCPPHLRSTRAVRIAFCPDSPRAVIAADDGSVQVVALWTEAGGDLHARHDTTLVPRAGDSAAICTLAVSADARWLACGDLDNRVRVFNLEEGCLHATLPVFRAMHTACAFSYSAGKGISSAATAAAETAASGGALQRSGTSDCVLVVPCVDNRVYVCDVRCGKTSHHVATDRMVALPPMILQHHECVVHVAFRPICDGDAPGTQLMLLCSSTFVVAVKVSQRNGAERGPSINPNNSNNATGTVCSQPTFQRRYQPMLYAGFAGKQELLLVECPWRRVMKSFPGMLRSSKGFGSAGGYALA